MSEKEIKENVKSEIELALEKLKIPKDQRTVEDKNEIRDIMSCMFISGTMSRIKSHANVLVKELDVSPQDAFAEVIQILATTIFSFCDSIEPDATPERYREFVNMFQEALLHVTTMSIQAREEANEEAKVERVHEEDGN